MRRRTESHPQREPSTLVFSRNVSLLVQQRQQANPRLTVEQIAKDLNISKRNLTNLRAGAHAATLETLDAVAAGVAMEPWELLLPDLPAQILLNPKVAKHIREYLRADTRVQEAIEDVADAIIRRGPHR